MVKAALFDIDGVIIRHTSFFSESLSSAEYREPGKTMGDFYKTTKNMECDKGVLDIFSEIRPFLDRMGWKGTAASYFNEQYAFESRFIDKDLLGRIRRLKDSGVKCYIASNQNYYRREHLKAALDISANFTHAFFSSELGYVKPEEGYWRRVVDRVRRDCGGAAMAKDDMVFLDDLEVNVSAADAFGIRSVLVSGESDIDRAFGMMGEPGAR